MSTGSMGGLGKKGKKKTSKNGAKERRNLQKFDKSVQKRALLCKKYAEIRHFCILTFC
jgi:hypothetical protein